MYRYISRESCSQFDSLPLTSLTRRSTGAFYGKGFVRCPAAATLCNAEKVRALNIDLVACCAHYKWSVRRTNTASPPSTLTAMPLATLSSTPPLSPRHLRTSTAAAPHRAIFSSRRHERRAPLLRRAGALSSAEASRAARAPARRASARAPMVSRGALASRRAASAAAAGTARATHYMARAAAPRRMTGRRARRRRRSAGSRRVPWSQSSSLAAQRVCASRVSAAASGPPLWRATF